MQLSSGVAGGGGGVSPGPDASLVIGPLSTAAVPCQHQQGAEKSQTGVGKGEKLRDGPRRPEG